MFAYLTQGIVLGLAAGLTPGPLLTFVVAQSMRHGLREGVKVSLVPFLTDLPILLAALLAVAPLAALQPALGVLTLAGAAFLFRLACENLRITATQPAATSDAPRSLGRGVLVNLLNPHVYLFWLTVGAPTTVKAWHVTPLAAAGFLTGFYACLTGSKIVVAWSAARSRTFLQGKPYLYLMRALGALLLLFAILLALESIRLLVPKLLMLYH